MQVLQLDLKDKSHYKMQLKGEQFQVCYKIFHERKELSTDR